MSQTPPVAITHHAMRAPRLSPHCQTSLQRHGDDAFVVTKYCYTRTSVTFNLHGHEKTTKLNMHYYCCATNTRTKQPQELWPRESSPPGVIKTRSATMTPTSPRGKSSCTAGWRTPFSIQLSSSLLTPGSYPSTLRR